MKHLFVVAHPDDEVLGAGAFIYDAVRKGDEVAVLVLNTCDTTRYLDDFEHIKTDLMKSHKILGIKHTITSSFKDSNFHNADHREMVQVIENAIRDFQPDYIFTQHPGDINTDHYWASASCMEAFRLWQRGNGEIINPVKGLYLMEVQSSTEWAVNPSIGKFDPNTFVEVSREGIEAKIEALAVYENVIRKSPHPRSVDSLLSLPVIRGSQAGVPLAEAFQCVFRLGGF